MGMAWVVVAVCCWLAPLVCQAVEDQPLEGFIEERIAEFGDIPANRREVLDELADYIRSQQDAGKIRLTFICTHNSRRSQMSQVWASIAAAHFGIKEFEAFSGGTEETAFNPRAVAALKRAGVAVEARSSIVDGENVRYAVAIPGQDSPLICFSKVYYDQANPSSYFAAVMTCSAADKNCPNIAGAAARVALPYDDPKSSDGTASEAQTYDERCREIAREMLYVFSLL